MGPQRETLALRVLARWLLPLGLVLGWLHGVDAVRAADFVRWQEARRTALSDPVRGEPWPAPSPQWTAEDGSPVPQAVINGPFAARGHCAPTYHGELAILPEARWWPGLYSAEAHWPVGLRRGGLYLRDWAHRWGDLYDATATLPTGAKDTGWRSGQWALWTDPLDDRHVYLVRGRTVERLPWIGERRGTCA